MKINIPTLLQNKHGPKQSQNSLACCVYQAKNTLTLFCASIFASLFRRTETAFVKPSEVAICKDVFPFCIKG